jgi:hypothetical protein
MAEVEAASFSLDNTCRALNRARHRAQDLRLEEVEALLSSRTLIVDACRFSIRHSRYGDRARSGVQFLFTLARLLAEAWPADVPRETLVAQAFRAKRADETLIARACESKSGDCAECFGRWQTSSRLSRGMRSCRAGHGKSSYSRGPSRTSTQLSSPCLAMASRGRARPSHLRSVLARVPCSGHSSRLGERARYSPWVAGGRVAG